MHIRFLALFVVTAIVVARRFDLPWWLGMLACFAIVWPANLYNFTDGSSGLVRGMIVCGFSEFMRLHPHAGSGARRLRDSNRRFRDQLLAAGLQNLRAFFSAM